MKPAQDRDVTQRPRTAPSRIKVWRCDGDEVRQAIEASAARGGGVRSECIRHGSAPVNTAAEWKVP